MRREVIKYVCKAQNYYYENNFQNSSEDSIDLKKVEIFVEKMFDIYGLLRKLDFSDLTIESGIKSKNFNKNGA